MLLLVLELRTHGSGGRACEDKAGGASLSSSTSSWSSSSVKGACFLLEGDLDEDEDDRVGVCPREAAAAAAEGVLLRSGDKSSIARPAAADL